MNTKDKHPPGKGELCFHKRRRELLEQLVTTSVDAASPANKVILDQLQDQADRLPSYVGQVVTPDGQKWSMALYPDDKSAIGKIRVSIRPWFEKDEPFT